MNTETETKPVLSGLTVTTQTEVPFQRIADMMIGAIEGGSTYWCRSFRRHEVPGGIELEERPWYADPKIYHLPGFSFRVIIDEIDEATGKPEQRFITAADFAKGLQIMAAKYPEHFTDLVKENDDATTADVFFQCVVLGEIVYG